MLFLCSQLLWNCVLAKPLRAPHKCCYTRPRWAVHKRILVELDLIQQRHCQLQYTSCCNSILLQAQLWLDSPFLCAKGNVSAFGGIYCQAAAHPARQRCSPAAGEGSRQAKTASAWQWGVTAQPSLTARRKLLCRLEKHTVKLQVGQRSQRDTGACLTAPQQSQGVTLEWLS